MLPLLMHCSLKTRRWPLCIFYGIVNAANVNSYIIYKENLQRTLDKPKLRRDFLLDVGKELIRPWAEKQMSAKHGIQCYTCSLAHQVFGIPIHADYHAPGTSFRNI